MPMQSVAQGPTGRFDGTMARAANPATVASPIQHKIAAIQGSAHGGKWYPNMADWSVT